MHALPRATALLSMIALTIACGSSPRQSTTRESDEAPTTSQSRPASNPAPTSTPSRRTDTETNRTTTAATLSGQMLTATLVMADGTTALFEVADPNLFRFESTQFTLTADGDELLAVFAEMNAYALMEAPQPVTFEALADLSPILEPTFARHTDLSIPTSATESLSGWSSAPLHSDPNRFSTTPPQFHRDITSQVARPVGDYTAMRLQGQTAPYFETTDLNGDIVTIADFEGKAMLIDFWATWCPPCLESMPKLDALDRRYGNAGLVVLGMNMDEGSAALRSARQFVSGHGFGFRQAVGGNVSDSFRVQVLPTLFLLDRNHTIQAVYVGLPPDEATLRREVEFLLR